MTDKRIMEIANTYGYDAQSRQCIEEMAELTQAINKLWRTELKCGEKELYEISTSSVEYRNLIEEIADVRIVLEQLESFLYADEKILEIMDYKLERQVERIRMEKDRETVWNR